MIHLTRFDDAYHHKFQIFILVLNVYATTKLVICNIVIIKFNVMHYSKLFLLVTFTIFLVGNSFSQERVIRGTVVDENLNPLPGVTVTAKGQDINIVTNKKGKFRLYVSDQKTTLCFSKQGMKKASATIDLYDRMVVKLATVNSRFNSDLALEDLLRLSVLVPKDRSTENELTLLKTK